ncbi:unnamed protein product [Ectocarpus fasciculatus]
MRTPCGQRYTARGRPTRSAATPCRWRRCPSGWGSGRRSGSVGGERVRPLVAEKTPGKSQSTTGCASRTTKRTKTPGCATWPCSVARRGWARQAPCTGAQRR